MGTFEYTLFLVLSFLSGLIMVMLAIRVFRLKPTTTTTLFAYLLIAVSIWAFAVGGGMLSPSQRIAFNWAILRMIGVLAVPPLWLMFALHYAHRQNRIQPWHQWLLGIVPLMTFILLITSDSHQLLIIGIDYELVNGYFVETDWQIGPFFWIHLAYSFVLILAGDVAIFEQAWRWSNKYKREAVILTIGTLFPLFTNAALTFNFFPAIKGNYDVAGFVIAGLLIFWGLFNEQMLDITPIAHQILVENIPDAIFMFDEQQRLVDINPAGLAFLNLPFEQALTQNPEQLFDPPISLPQQHQISEYSPVQTQPEQWYEVHSIPLQQQEHHIGYLLTLRDISQQHRLTKELRMLATTDSLTGLANRRHFMEQSIQYVHHALRYGHDLSLIMLDIDFFKKINDEFGHAVGDQILIKLTETLAQNIRSVDILARYGGEEFCILLPETAMDSAYPMAERLRWLIKETSFTINGVRHRISISLGVSSLNKEKVSVDILLNRADHAMYHSKRNGRDQVTIWNPEITLEQ